MKKIYLFGALLLSTLSFGQIIYEGFDYTGTIGGNTSGTDASPVNNWQTISNSQIGTIDVSTPSLNYTTLVGYPTSTGGKVLLPGSNGTTARDVTRSIPSSNTSNIMYFSALINVVDNTQLTTNPDYFMAFATGTTTFGGRLAAAAVNSGSNYRLSIQNTSGGTPTFTEFPTDLNFGTTYLIVVKYDRSTSPTTATLWVNPDSLVEANITITPATNNSGTGTFASFASILLRNAASTNAPVRGTPKVYIDEIRVDSSYGNVLPIDKFDNITGLQVYPNPAKNTLNITSNNFAEKQVELYDVLGKKALSAKVTNQSVNITNLSKGMYIVKITEEGKTATRKIVIE